jgi:hypothetical protein
MNEIDISEGSLGLRVFSVTQFTSALYTRVLVGEMSRKEALSHFIQQIHGRPVVVKLNNGTDYRGK